MEHVERAGVHSGDSMSVYPVQTLSQHVQDQIIDYTEKLAHDLNCIGMMNIQFVIQNDQAYCIEVNPRASRTVPFLSKVTDIPMAQIATKVILGKTLKEQGYKNGVAPVGDLIHVKAPVFSFSKLADVDSLLGPEMKSTGEVMGTDKTFEKALYKAFEGTKTHVPAAGKVIFSVKPGDLEEAEGLAERFVELGHELMAEGKTANYFKENNLEVEGFDDSFEGMMDMIGDKQVQVVVNTIDEEEAGDTEGKVMRGVTTEHSVPLFTALDTVDAVLKVLEAQSYYVHSI
jgi:carbamoyl-phosphate synthase large subunit